MHTDKVKTCIQDTDTNRHLHFDQLCSLYRVLHAKSQSAHTNIHTYINIHSYMHTDILTQIYASSKYINAYVHMCPCVHVCVYLCTSCMYVCLHVLHVFIHIRLQPHRHVCCGIRPERTPTCSHPAARGRTRSWCSPACCRSCRTAISAVCMYTYACKHRHVDNDPHAGTDAFMTIRMYARTHI